MLNFEEFMEKVKQEILNYLPEEKQKNDLIVVINPILKINRSVHGLAIYGLNSNSNIVNQVYLEQMYHNYLLCDDFVRIIKSAVSDLLDERNTPPAELFLNESLDDKSKIINRIINSKRNQELLSKVPHLDFMDLSIIFKYYIQSSDEGILSTTIDQKHADVYLKMNASELFQAALDNSRYLFPIVVTTLYEQYLRSKDESDELEYMEIGNDFSGQNLLIITNDIAIDGATCILYGDVLQDISTRINDDFYLLPSSVHEMILVPAEFANGSLSGAATLLEMVSEANETAVGISDYLSDSVYYYDRTEKKIFLVDKTGDINRDSYFDPEVWMPERKKDTADYKKEKYSYVINYIKKGVSLDLTVIAEDENKAIEAFEKYISNAKFVRISSEESSKVGQPIIYT